MAGVRENVRILGCPEQEGHCACCLSEMRHRPRVWLWDGEAGGRGVGLEVPRDEEEIETGVAVDLHELSVHQDVEAVWDALRLGVTRNTVNSVLKSLTNEMG